MYSDHKVVGHIILLTKYNVHFQNLKKNPFVSFLLKLKVVLIVKNYLFISYSFLFKKNNNPGLPLLYKPYSVNFTLE